MEHGPLILVILKRCCSHEPITHEKHVCPVFVSLSLMRNMFAHAYSTPRCFNLNIMLVITQAHSSIRSCLPPYHLAFLRIIKNKEMNHWPSDLIP